MSTDLMLTKAAPQQTDSVHRRRAENLPRKRFWLPGFLYDCLPYLYLTAGFAAFFATLYITDWFWVLPHYLLLAGAGLHLGAILIRRRTPSRNPDTNRPEDLPSPADCSASV